MISAAPDYIKAHNPRDCWSTLYRRAADGAWEEVREGLPGPEGLQTQLLGSNPSEPGVFYMSTTSGELYRSADAGRRWERLDVRWPEGLSPTNVRAVVPSPE